MYVKANNGPDKKLKIQMEKNKKQKTKRQKDKKQIQQDQLN